jgi:hypothetical protein
MEGDKDVDENRHEPRSMAGTACIVKARLPDSALIFPSENP